MTKEHLTGVVERLTFQSEETGFTVAKLKTPKKSDLVCVVGKMPSIQPGETIEMAGFWKHDPNYGYQFLVETYHVKMPSDIMGIKKYLGSGLIKGIGPVYATRIVARFKEDTLLVIDQSPEKILEVDGIGKKRIALIKQCWDEQRSIRELMIFLQTYNVSPSYAQKIFKVYQDDSIAFIKKDPYALARDIWGIGFKTADSIAEKLGFKSDSNERIDAGIEYVLSELSNSGHACSPMAIFLTSAKEILSVKTEQIEARLHTQHQKRRIMIGKMGDIETDFIWLSALYYCEEGIKKELHRIQTGLSRVRAIDLEKAIEEAGITLGLLLADNQKIAIHYSLTEKIHIITGGPGTGKSTITSAILHVAKNVLGRIILAAPTGRAAKRMAEVTGMEASTIHSLLSFDFAKGGFRKNLENPLECDLIIIDESSMIDTSLMYSLLKAIPDTSKVIFVGDINQLPSVGPGTVLKDMIQSQTIKTSLLTNIFRQARGSKIITNAHRINKGLFPDINNQKTGDFFFLQEDDPEKIAEVIVGLVKKRLPEAYDFNPLHDIQVLSPMNRGVIGISNLNIVLQNELNPNDDPLIKMGRRFHAGDKVIQLKNNYDKDVFNGDVGVIVQIDSIDQQLIVRFDSNEVVYDYSDIDQLSLAYAVSVHKYQGSECPCIVMPMHTTHYMLLNRNLFYTGVTRSKKNKPNVTADIRYYMTNSSRPPVELARAIRDHWHIENSLHWVLDMTFNEDYCRIRHRNEAMNMALIRKFVLNLIHKDPKKGSIKGKRKKANWSNDYLLELLSRA